MARRNIFQPPPAPHPTEPAVAETRPRFPNTGAMSGMKSTLRDLSSNAVREIDPAQIDDDGPKDRLGFHDSDVVDLTESIRQHGQQVPIMVRALPDRPGRFRIVYGRRRLRALRVLGIPAKALIRSLSDEQAIIAQGQENSQRLDPSFIEKALFATELGEAGYDPAVIMDALAIDKPMLSRMGKVARVIPTAIVQMIGPAHGVGRRRWEDLADAVRDRAIELGTLCGRLVPELEPLPSDARFARVADAVAQATVRQIEKPPAQSVTHADGTRLAEVRDTPRALTIKLATADSPGFTDWMRGNASTVLAQLYDAWKTDTGRD